MRDRFSPRPLWRLPAECGCRRCSSGRSGPCSRGSPRRRRSAAGGLRGGLSMAPRVPALRRPLIALRGPDGRRPHFFISRRNLARAQYQKFWNHSNGDADSSPGYQMIPTIRSKNPYIRRPSAAAGEQRRSPSDSSSEVPTTINPAPAPRDGWRCVASHFRCMLINGARRAASVSPS